MADEQQNLPAQTTQAGVPEQVVKPGSPIGDRAIKQLWLIIILAAAIAGGITLFNWAKEPAYKTLFADLSGRDATKVMEALGKINIPYKIDNSTGAVMVPSGQVYEARLKLAGEGLPSGSGRGFELLEEEQGFGTSQFVETARYNHALESEIARSITQIQSVESARVHLALAKKSAFVRDQGKSKASVVVNLYPGRGLSDGQVASVVHLVASSVSNMEYEDVTVIDQRGRLLSRNNEDGLMAQSTRQLEYRQSIESMLISRIETILTPFIGDGGVRASVAAELDFSFSESTREQFDKEGVVRSEQTSEETNSGGVGSGGVPGALTNQPPTAAGLTSGESAAGGGGNSTRNAVRNYELGKTISHQKSSSGEIKKLTIAVVVDDMPAKDGGESQPLTQQQLDNITALVKEAVGFDEERGDRLSVMNASFKKPSKPVVEEPGMLEQPWFMDVVRIVAFALVGIILVMVVIKPVIKALIPKIEPKVVAAPAPAPVMAAAGAEPVAPPPQIEKQVTQFDSDVDKAREIASEDPALAANIVKSWMEQES
ncbi:MAG: flagellar basal body M-ring protein FliF [Gammaproteobacteria bacterium]|nr:MAG: flagellar basal body M-ring protein FliF [Gammaproteobacteria bacterium]